MTGSNVMNLLSVGTNCSTRKDSKRSVSFSNDFMTSFQKMMSANSYGKQSASSSSAIDSKMKTDTSMSNEYRKNQYKEPNIKESSISSPEESAYDVATVLSETKEELVQTISDELGIDREEVTSVLGQLGMTLLNLLEPQNLVAFVQLVSGVSDTSELLMSEEFQQLFAHVSELALELTNETEFSLDELIELDSLLTQAKDEKLNSAPNVQAVADRAEEKISDESEGAVITETVTQEQTSTKETQTIDENLMSQELDENRNASAKRLMEDTSDGFSQRNSSRRELSGEEDAVLTAEPVVDQPVTFGELRNMISSYTQVDTESVMKQMVEQVRLSSKTQETTIEMQLNPESLGKMYINISSKEGSVHAQIYTSNDAVKEALEAQIIDLKENLNQAGVKVDAVEVSVGTHGFERNLEQDQKHEEENGQYQEQLSSKRRNLRMDSLDDLAGVMTEEESLILQIMKDNGNSVDLTA